MIRINEIRLPIDHQPQDLELAVLRKLKLEAKDFKGLTVFKRSHDARKNVALSLIYIVDVDVANESAVLQRCEKQSDVRRSPDTSYHYVGQAPANLNSRPVIIGFGPCGIFAALILAQMGF